MYSGLSLWQRIKLGLLKRMTFLPPHIYLPYYYQYYTGKVYDDDNPKEFNEKIQWLKLHYHNPLLNQLIDKYAVRAYVAERIGEQYLNDVIAVYDHPSQVDFDQLPDSFVLKGVHGYGYNLIVPDKSQLNRCRARRLLWKWYRRNPYKRGMQWGYKDIPPRFVAERYLSELNQSSIIDYKINCFGGVPHFLEIHVERSNKQRHKCGYFDLNLQPMPFRDVPEKTLLTHAEKPANFELMIELAHRLSEGLPFVRVDFYNLEGRIIFGEMTFYPAGGTLDYIPDKYNRIIGDLIPLPSPIGVCRAKCHSQHI